MPLDVTRQILVVVLTGVQVHRHAQQQLLVQRVVEALQPPVTGQAHDRAVERVAALDQVGAVFAAGARLHLRQRVTAAL